MMIVTTCLFSIQIVIVLIVLKCCTFYVLILFAYSTLGSSQIFTLSAVPFHMMPSVLAECLSVMKPGGWLFFRDYGMLTSDNIIGNQLCVPLLSNTSKKIFVVSRI